MRVLLNQGVRAAGGTRPVRLQATDQLRECGSPLLQEHRFFEIGLVFTDWLTQAAMWSAYVNDIPVSAI